MDYGLWVIFLLGLVWQRTNPWKLLRSQWVVFVCLLVFLSILLSPPSHSYDGALTGNESADSSFIAIFISKCREHFYLRPLPFVKSVTASLLFLIPPFALPFSLLTLFLLFSVFFVRRLIM